MFSLKIFLSLVLLVLLISTYEVSATTYYAASGGTNNSCGASTSRNTPRSGLWNGVSCLSGGDTLILLDGVYDQGLGECGNWPCLPNGNSGAPTVLKAENKWGAIIRVPFGNGGAGVNIFYFNNQHDLTIDSLDFDLSAMPAGNVVGIANLGNQGNILIQNNRVRDVLAPGSTNGCTGITLGHTLRSGASYTVRVANNVFQDIGYGFNENHEDTCMGFYAVGDHLIIENNSFARIGGNCGESWSGGTNPPNDNNLFRNNICTQTGGAGLRIASGTFALIYNNIVYNHSTNPNLTPAGIYVGGVGKDTVDYRVYNNTIYNGRGDCILISAAGPITRTRETKVKNNICYRNQFDRVYNPDGVDLDSSNNLLGSDPFFVSASAADFHLTSNSVLAINQGANLAGLVDVDYDGNSRNDGSWDIGAFEFGSGPVQPPVNTGVTAIFCDSVPPDGTLPCSAATDGNNNTFWHTDYFAGLSSPPHPHQIWIDVGVVSQGLRGFTYLRRQDTGGGAIGSFQVYVSNDTSNWGSVVYSGSLANSTTLQTVLFPAIAFGRYLRLVALDSSNGTGQPWTSIAEINVVRIQAIHLQAFFFGGF